MRTTRASERFAPVVLLLTNRKDVTADLVVRRLDELDAPFLRLNSDDLATWCISLQPHQSCYRLTRDGEIVDLAHVKGVWFRRPDPQFIQGLSSVPEPHLDFARSQWSAVVRNLEALPRASWMNSPGRNRTAESKLLQLTLAKDCGLSIPKTFITNSRRDVEQLARSAAPRPLIAKGLYAPAVGEESNPSFVYTRLIDETTIEAIAEHELIPFVVQEAILPKLDLRVTIVDEHVIGAVGKVPDAAEEVDWRAVDPPVQFKPFDLSEEIAEGLRELRRRLGLRFGAADLAVREDGSIVFLEINPNGEWGWLEQAHGIEISQYLARALAHCQ